MQLRRPTAAAVRSAVVTSHHRCDVFAPFALQMRRCGTSQGSGKGNLFAFLGVPLSVRCDVALLQKQYHVLQSSIHPDKQQLLSSSEAVTDASTYANAAYETLKDPFRRCRYLLKYAVAEQRKGGERLTPAEEEAVNSSDDSRENLGALRSDKKHDELDAEFLMQMMELNEAVFGFDSENLTPEDRQQLDAIEADIKAMDKMFQEKAYAAWEAKNIREFRDAVLRWTYVNNLKHHIHQLK